MKMRSTWRAFLLAGGAGVLLLSACGGGGYGSGGGSGGGMYGGGGSTLLTGSFLDAATAGVHYTASGAGVATIAGITGASGQFSYYAGQTVTFALPGGAAGSIALGSALPVAPAMGNAVVFVGGLANGLAAAQVLQSLNHAASAGAIDVSGLTLSATDVANLGAFITSGGTAFGTAASYTAMMQAAQASASSAMPSLTFVYPGGATAAQAAANLAAAAGALAAPASITVNGLYFYQFVATAAGGTATFADAGLVAEVPGSSAGAGTFTEIDAVHALQTASSVHNGTFSVAGNVLTDTRATGAGTQATTVTVTYQDSAKTLFNLSTTLNSAPTGSGTGNAYLVTALMPAQMAGRTLTFSGNPGALCSAGSLQLVFAMSGTTWASYCSGSTTATGTGTVGAGPTGIATVELAAPPTAPDTVGSTLLLALASGSVLTGGNGTMAVLTTANEASFGIDGLFPFSVQ